MFLLEHIEHLLGCCLIIGAGVWLHITGFSVIDLKYYQISSLIPNISSTIFIFSALCILVKMRPFWPRNSRRLQPLIQFFIDLTIILFAADILLRQFWLPILKIIHFLCRFCGQFLITLNQNFLSNTAPSLSQWLRNDGFYLITFILALSAFIFMIEITGIVEIVKNKLRGQTDDSALNADEYFLMRLANDDVTQAALNNEWPYCNPPAEKNVPKKTTKRRRSRSKKK